MRRRLLYYRIWPAVYRRAAKKPIDEKKVLLASKSRTLPDNLSCMKRELESRGMHCTELLIPAGAGSLSGRAAESSASTRRAGSSLSRMRSFRCSPIIRERAPRLFSFGTLAAHSKNGAIPPPTSSGARTERASSAILSTTPIPPLPCRPRVLFRIMPRRSTAPKA